MVRIVWGVIFILLGLFVIGQTFVALSFLQAASQISGKGSNVTPQMLSMVDFYASLFFSVALCLSGSFLIYFGSRARRSQLQPVKFQRPSISDRPEQGNDW